jgi:hypothetical protein
VSRLLLGLVDASGEGAGEAEGSQPRLDLLGGQSTVPISIQPVKGALQAALPPRNVFSEALKAVAAQTHVTFDPPS